MAIPALSTNTPVVGSITWAGFNIQFGGVAYSVSSGSTAQKFVWWRYNGGAPLLQAGAEPPQDLTLDDLLLFGNKNGTPINLQTAGLIEGGLIVDGSILADALSANSVTAEKILAGSINATHILANTITAAEISANAITADELAANAVIAGKIQATAIDGMTITGATLQTNPATDIGVKINDAGVIAYGEGIAKTTIDAATGQLSAVDGLFTGSVTASEGEILGALTLGPDGSINIGARITISLEDGITIWGDDEHSSIKARLHPDGNFLDGVLEAQEITVIQALRLIGLYSELASGAKLTIANGISDPPAPALTSNVITSTFPKYNANERERGTCWDATAGVWRQLIWNSNNSRMYLRTVNEAGTSASGFTIIPEWDSELGLVDCNSLAVVGTKLLIWGKVGGTNPVEWKLMSFNISSGSSVTFSAYVTDYVTSAPGAVPAVGSAGTFFFTVRGAFLNRYTSALALSSTTYLGDSVVFNNLINARAVSVGNFDLGTEHVAVHAASGIVYMFTPSWGGGNSTQQTARDFASTGWMVWKSSGTLPNFFYSVSSTIGQLTRYSAYIPTTNEKWWVQYADKVGALTTAVSPETSIAVPARRFVTASLRPAEAGVTGSDVFVGYGTTTPGATKKKRTETLAGRALLMTNGKVTGTDAMPSTNNAGGSPAELKDNFGNSWKGNGEIDLPGLVQGWSTQKSSGAVNTMANTVWQSVPGLSLTIDNPGTSAVWEIRLDADLTVTTAGTPVCRLQVNNVVQGGEVFIAGAASTRALVGRTWRVTGLPASATLPVAVDTRMGGGGAGTLGSSTVLFVRRIS